jgi:uncharacterized protein (TIGR02687 family)
MKQISEALQKLFERHRLLFWYDEKSEFAYGLGDLELPGVEVLQVKGNEFWVKYHVMREAPQGRFLLYFPHARPENAHNWLLDLELANYLFYTDQAALYLQELGLDIAYKDLVNAHIEFFRSKERRSRLRELLGADESEGSIRYKMLAVVFGVDYANLETYLQAHAAAWLEDNTQPDRDLERYQLRQFYWNLVYRKYHYKSDEPTIYDFLLEIFAQHFSLTRKSEATRESGILLSRWRDSHAHREALRALTRKAAQDLGVEERLSGARLEDLLDDDLFQEVDRRIVSELAALVERGEISRDRLLQIVKRREQKFWYGDFQVYYECLLHGSEMLSHARQAGQTQFTSFSQGVQDYATTLYQADYYYRQFIRSYRQSGQSPVLADLASKVQKAYSNDWLLPLNDRWQAVVDGLKEWPIDHPHGQRQFFVRHVRPYLERKQRLFVVISDALRYECGQELLEQIQAEKRFDGTIDYLISGLPSYTQLGMAALLPHKELRLEEKSDTVKADGLSTQGMAARAKVLAEASGVRATAIGAEEFMRMSASTEGRDFVKQYDLIYIYHNRIDKTGDDKTTEDKVFEAVQEEIRFLPDLLRKIGNMNGYNILITADHGFIYQHQALEESDFSQAAFSGDIWKESRRFVIGQDLQSDNGARHFKGGEIGLQEGVEALIPKSINRLRVKGAGSRYVHGGAALQEIVAPLLKISYKRQDTTSKVEVDIIQSATKITTNILPLSFLQVGLVGEKVLPREIRACLQAKDGTPVSDLFQYNFDIPEGSERQREVKHRFQISSTAAVKYKNQQIRLVLEEPVEGSNQWKMYKEFFYTLNISFSSDFDEF